MPEDITKLDPAEEANLVKEAAQEETVDKAFDSGTTPPGSDITNQEASDGEETLTGNNPLANNQSSTDNETWLPTKGIKDEEEREEDERKLAKIQANIKKNTKSRADFIKESYKDEPWYVKEALRFTTAAVNFADDATFGIVEAYTTAKDEGSGHGLFTSVTDDLYPVTANVAATAANIASLFYSGGVAPVITTGVKLTAKQIAKQAAKKAAGEVAKRIPQDIAIRNFNSLVAKQVAVGATKLGVSTARSATIGKVTSRVLIASSYGAGLATVKGIGNNEGRAQNQVSIAGEALEGAGYGIATLGLFNYGIPAARWAAKTSASLTKATYKFGQGLNSNSMATLVDTLKNPSSVLGNSKITVAMKDAAALINENLTFQTLTEFTSGGLLTPQSRKKIATFFNILKNKKDSQLLGDHLVKLPKLKLNQIGGEVLDDIGKTYQKNNTSFGKSLQGDKVITPPNSVFSGSKYLEETLASVVAQKKAFQSLPSSKQYQSQVDLKYTPTTQEKGKTLQSLVDNYTLNEKNAKAVRNVFILNRNTKTPKELIAPITEKIIQRQKQLAELANKARNKKAFDNGKLRDIKQGIDKKYFSKFKDVGVLKKNITNKANIAINKLQFKLVNQSLTPKVKADTTQKIKLLRLERNKEVLAVVKKHIPNEGKRNEYLSELNTVTRQFTKEQKSLADKIAKAKTYTDSEMQSLKVATNLVKEGKFNEASNTAGLPKGLKTQLKTKQISQDELTKILKVSDETAVSTYVEISERYGRAKTYAQLEKLLADIDDKITGYSTGNAVKVNSKAQLFLKKARRTIDEEVETWTIHNYRKLIDQGNTAEADKLLKKMMLKKLTRATIESSEVTISVLNNQINTPRSWLQLVTGLYTKAKVKTSNKAVQKTYSSEEKANKVIHEFTRPSSKVEKFTEKFGEEFNDAQKFLIDDSISIRNIFTRDRINPGDRDE